MKFHEIQEFQDKWDPWKCILNKIYSIYKVLPLRTADAAY